eukprot:1026481-Pyramimonas_sp.AAC.1
MECPSILATQSSLRHNGSTLTVVQASSRTISTEFMALVSGRAAQQKSKRKETLLISSNIIAST